MPHIQDVAAHWSQYVSDHFGGYGGELTADLDPVSNWDWQSYIDRALESTIENAAYIPLSQINPHEISEGKLWYAHLAANAHPGIDRDPGHEQWT